MITADLICFPNNVVELIALRAKQVMDEKDPSGDTIVVKRPLTTLDADQTIGVTPVDWGPTASPKGLPEMGRRDNQFENTIQSYSIMVQALINDMDEDVAINRHSYFSTLVRRMLYRDTILLSALSQLAVTSDGVRESYTQGSPRSQQWLVTRKDASFQYLSVIEFAFETQTN